MSESNCSKAISLEDLPAIRPFPEIASRILKACDDPATTANKLCDLIQGDPSISLKIIQVANSSAYGLAGEVRTLRHAVVVLGFRTLKSLALSVAAADVFQSASDAKQARDALWEHSLAVACIANRLSKSVNIDAEEAFLAGIVHDAGKLVFLDLAPEDYMAATENDNLQSIIETEKSLYGIDHQELGLRCADEWGLPFEITEAIGNHHMMFDEQDNDPLVELVAISDSLSRHWGIGSPRVEEDLEALMDSTSVGLSIDELEIIEDEIGTDFADLKACFGK